MKKNRGQDTIYNEDSARMLEGNELGKQGENVEIERTRRRA